MPSSSNPLPQRIPILNHDKMYLLSHIKKKIEASEKTFFFLKSVEILTFISNEGDDGLDVGLFIGLLHHAEPVLQILEALVVGDIVNQQDALRERTAQLSFHQTAHTAEGSLCSASALHWLHLHSDNVAQTGPAGKQ